MPRKRRRSTGEGGIRRRVIRRPDGSSYTRYSALVTLGWADGSQQRVEGPRRATEREALQDLKDLNRQKDDGLLTTDNPTVAEYLDYWLAQVKPSEDEAVKATRKQIAAKTYQGFKGDVENHIKPALGALKLRALEPLVVSRWQKGLERSASVYVAKNASATLSSALSKAAAWRLVERSPYAAGGVAKVALPHKEADYWEPSEAAAFIRSEQARVHPFFIGYYLTLNLGFRIGELRGLKWEDLLWLENKRTGENVPHLHVRRQAVDDRGLPTLTERLKTKTSNRLIPVPASCLEMLNAWRCTQKDDPHGLNLILTTSVGTSPSTTNFRQDFYALCQDIGVRKLKIHGLRHTAGSLWLEAGVPLMRVSRWLGHSSVKTSEGIYIHTIQEASYGESIGLETMLELVK